MKIMFKFTIQYRDKEVKMGLEFGIRDHIQAIELLQNITAVNKKDLVLDSVDQVALRVMNLIPYVVKSLTIHVE